MNILGKAARAICQCNGNECLNCDGKVQHFKGQLPEGTKHERDRPCPYLEEEAAAINAFLAAAAEEGWHMRPDEATKEMVTAGYSWCWENGAPPCYRAMLAAAPEFEWNK